MIALHDALIKMDEKDRNGRRILCNIDYIKLSTGEVEKYRGVHKTGLRHNMKDQRTIGIKFKTGETKALKIRLIKTFNGENVFW